MCTSVMKPLVDRVEVRGYSRWACRWCGSIARGDRVSLTLDYLPTAEDLRLRIPRNCMPVGWISEGAAGVFCSTDCHTKSAQLKSMV